MSLSFQDLQEALTLDDKDEFVIWQNSSKRNKRVKRGNLFASKGVTVRGKFIDSESGDDVGLIAVNAQIAAELAEADAEAAQAAANGKNRIFYNSGRGNFNVSNAACSGPTLTFTGTSVVYGSGGSYTNGVQGTGGGARGVNPTANRGGGGGGGDSNGGHTSGATGFVAVRFQ